MSKRAYGKSVASYTAWAALTAYVLTNYRVPTTDNGMCYECTTAGTSGATEPVWDAGLNSPTSDGTVVWTCREKAASPAALSLELDAGGLGGAPLKDVWVKSDEAATFIIYGSYDGNNWRYLSELDVPDGERLSNHQSFYTSYPYIAAGTATVASNEIEIVAGE